MVRVKTALLSAYYKDGLEPLVQVLSGLHVDMISTGGTLDFLRKMGHPARAVEDITQFPEMLGGRVKTLHPKVFGGILSRREEPQDRAQIAEFDVPEIDLVVVNLYPFEETVALGGTHEAIIEKIDVGGVSLIRAAAKNHKDVVIVADPADYQCIADELRANQGFITFETRKKLAAKAFQITSSYDAAIGRYLYEATENQNFPDQFVATASPVRMLRYGENPHQKGAFYGKLDQVFHQLHGKEMSYNNMVDASAALDLIREFGTERPATVIVKHTNACGVAVSDLLSDSYARALDCDPISAFGGVIAMNRVIDVPTAVLLNDLFFEVLIAPGFEDQAFNLLKIKKNRILLTDKGLPLAKVQVKTLFNGLLVQEADQMLAQKTDCKVVTEKEPDATDWANLLFANKIVKHTKSNTIVLAKDGILLASGTGQTSRVDALHQAIQKAQNFGFDLAGASLASDAFFPFADCVEIAAAQGIASVIQPGGSVRDQDSIDACNRSGISMVTTGIRHFKH